MKQFITRHLNLTVIKEVSCPMKRFSIYTTSVDHNEFYFLLHICRPFAVFIAYKLFEALLETISLVLSPLFIEMKQFYMVHVVK